ncbi:MAG: alpha/beta hydrolase [Clostridia bacterium]|nr:alpha/beta hydrolase [Clostridia bacterium]
MSPYLIVGIAVIAFICIVLAIAYYCFRRVFYSPARTPLKEDEYEIPPGEIYEPYREEMVAWMKETREMPHEKVSVSSFDGLTLRGRYYEYQKGAPVEMLFHGYQGNSERDLCGGVQRCFSLGRNALLIDQRGSGESDGHVISFGINERKDCLKWIEFAIEKFGKDVKIMLGGVSMGAATVLMTAGETLPENVVCALGDCGYSSAKEIIQKIVKEMHLPPKLVYPFIKLGARLFGHFDLDETSPVKAMETCKIPVLLLHGDEDAFVPFEMSQKIYDACTTPKRLITIKGAGHGLAYPKDKAGYIAALKEFEKEYL